jgi:hypothetical protein
MAAGVGIVLAWTWLFQTHTTLHKFWMVRMTLVPLSLGWGALAWLLTSAAGDRGAAAPTTPAESSLSSRPS